MRGRREGSIACSARLSPRAPAVASRHPPRGNKRNKKNLENSKAPNTHKSTPPPRTISFPFYSIPPSSAPPLFARVASLPACPASSRRRRGPLPPPPLPQQLNEVNSSAGGARERARARAGKRREGPGSEPSCALRAPVTDRLPPDTHVLSPRADLLLLLR